MSARKRLCAGPSHGPTHRLAPTKHPSTPKQRAGTEPRPYRSIVMPDGGRRTQSTASDSSHRVGWLRALSGKRPPTDVGGLWSVPVVPAVVGVVDRGIVPAVGGLVDAPELQHILHVVGAGSAPPRRERHRSAPILVGSERLPHRVGADLCVRPDTLFAGSARGPTHGSAPTKPPSPPTGRGRSPAPTRDRGFLIPWGRTGHMPVH